MKICFLTSDISGPAAYRCLLPGLELEKQFGHECYVPDFEGDLQKDAKLKYKVNLELLMDSDIIVLQQRPEKAWLRLIPQLQQRGKIVVCETDDYYGGLPPNHPARNAIDEAGVRRLHRIYGLADALTVSTPFLARAYRHLNPNIHVLPNFLDWEMWATPPQRTWDRLRIGWMGLAYIRQDDLSVLKGVIGPFLERHPEVDFVAAGDPGVHDILGIPEKQRVSYPRVQFWDVPKITATMDIGLVPLAMHNFNQAKSNLKGMEYAACGIPCIASPTEPYQQWSSEGACLLAKRARDWDRELERLCGDRALRERMGTAARAAAQRHTIQEHAHQWHDLYAELAGDRYDALAREAVKRGALQKPTELAAFLRSLEGKEPRVVVEIGTAQGGTLGALCSVAADDALVVSIDLPGGDRDETSEDDKYGERDTSRMAGYGQPGQDIEFLQMDSHHLATRATLERLLDYHGRTTIDLLFIDGDHSYDGVKRDFELYSVLVAPDGFIAFHDVLTHDHEGTEVDRLWAELKKTYKTREFKVHGEDWGWGEWGGIGVIDMGEQVGHRATTKAA